MNSEKNKQIAPQVVLAQHGNKDAYRKLYLAYYKNIFFICKLMSGSTAEAMKLTEEIFNKMFASVSKLSDHMAFEQWFYSIAINVCKPAAAENGAKMADVGENMKNLVSEIHRCVLEGDKFGFERSMMKLLEEVIYALPDELKVVFFYSYFASLGSEIISLLEKKDKEEIEKSVAAVDLFIEKISEKLKDDGVDISPFVKDMENTLCYLASHTFVPDSVHQRISETAGADLNPFAQNN